MNKKRVDGWIPLAREALETCGVVKEGVIDRSAQGLLSSFGAMVLSGSLRAAVAYFCDRGRLGPDRPRLLSAIYYCISGHYVEPQQVLSTVCAQDSPALKEQFIDAAIALKLAMGVYEQR